MDLYQLMDTGIICYIYNRRGGPEFIFPDVTYVPIARSRPVCLNLPVTGAQLLHCLKKLI
jgi:hypothetical protein